jgi:PAS domain S-box-containing protein
LENYSQINPEKDIKSFLTYQLEFEKLLSGISYSLIGVPDEKTDDLIIDSLRQVSAFIGAVKSLVFLLDTEKQSITKTHEWKEDPDDRQKEIDESIPVDRFLYIRALLALDKNAIFNKIEDFPEEATDEIRWCSEFGFRPIMFIPIRYKDRMVGTIGFLGKRNNMSNWPEETGDLLRVFGDIIWNVLSKMRMNRILRLTQFTFDSYSQPIYWLDSNNKIVNHNPAACTSLGYNCEELLSMHAWDIDPHFPKNKSQDFFQHLKSVKSNTRESFHKKKNGDQYPVELTAYFIQFEGQELACVFSQDITERKTAEKTIRKSEQQYKRVFDNIVDVFYEASMDGILLNVSPSVEQYFKYKREEMIGMPMLTFYADIKERDILLKKLQEDGFLQGYEVKIKDKDGIVREGLLSSRIIMNDEGEPERIVGSILDISELKKAEKQIKQLSSAIEQSPLVVIFTDIEGTVEYVNQMFYLASGLEEKDVLGRHISRISTGTFSLDQLTEILATVSQGKSWQGELEYKHDGEKSNWYELSVSAIQDDKGSPSHIIFLIQDITKRKEFEENLKIAKQKAELSDHLKSSFLANMSHEIRTPMNAILGFASLLKENDLPPEQINYYIDIINTKGRDLLRIISDIIDISRIEAGDLLIKMEPVEVYQFIQEIYAEYKEDSALSTRPNLSFRINIPEKKRKVILNTDPSRLKQVIINLIQNALKFTTEGYIEVGFSFKGKNNVKFYVKDTGIGIPKEKQKIIFDRFRQVDDNHTREYGGTGLGLTISKNLVEKLGGKLEVESDENQGSLFYFDLKCISTDSSMDMEDNWAVEIEEKVPLATEKTLDLSNKRILVAEDDGSSFIFLETILKKYNAEIVWVKSGTQVIEHLEKENHYDLILMDIRMPDLDGIETTKMIRQLNNPVPIIAQTAYAQTSDKKLALDSGCDDYISKPIKIADLTALLEKYLG